MIPAFYQCREKDESKVGLWSLTEHLDTSTSTGKLVLTVISEMAEFERNLISERTKAGMKAARDRGSRGGHPAKLTKRQLGMAEFMLTDSSNTGQKVADQFGVHRGTLSWHCATIANVATQRSEKEALHGSPS